MTRIVTLEEAQRLLDTPSSVPGSSDWDFAYVNTYLANFIDSGPDLTRTVIIRTDQVTELQKINGYKDRIIRQQENQIKRLQEQIDNTALVNEDGMEVRVERVRKAILDEGRHPPYHLRQMERLRQEWPVLYHAIMGLVKP